MTQQTTMPPHSPDSTLAKESQTTHLDSTVSQHLRTETDEHQQESLTSLTKSSVGLTRGLGGADKNKNSNKRFSFRQVVLVELIIITNNNLIIKIFIKFILQKVVKMVNFKIFCLRNINFKFS
jgi:hypothetical protein